MKKQNFRPKEIFKMKNEIFGPEGLLSVDNEPTFYFNLTRFLIKHKDMMAYPYFQKFMTKVSETPLTEPLG